MTFKNPLSEKMELAKNVAVVRAGVVSLFTNVIQRTKLSGSTTMLYTTG
jgi:hypothetical protein